MKIACCGLGMSIDQTLMGGGDGGAGGYDGNGAKGGGGGMDMGTCRKQESAAERKRRSYAARCAI